MINRSILYLAFALGIVMSLFASGKVQEDLYVGKSIEQIILLLGEPSFDNLKIISEKYIGFESEPDFSMFFSLEELRETITVRVVTWDKGKERIVVWGKRNYDEWVIFSSLKSGKNVYF